MAVALFYDAPTPELQRQVQTLVRAYGTERLWGAYDLTACEPTDLEPFAGVVFAVPVADPAAWLRFIDQLRPADVQGKRVALVALADPASCSGKAADVLGDVWERLHRLGAELVGHWPIQGHPCLGTRGLRDAKHFLGFVPNPAPEAEPWALRAKAWAAKLRRDLRVAAILAAV
jgi:hypothetical protein